MMICAPCTIAWAILPAAILPSGISTRGLRPAFAAYAAIDAEVLPVEAHTTASAPSCRATEIAVVIPRSLNDPVGLLPSTLSHTCAPVSDRTASRSARAECPPSRRVTGSRSSGSRSIRERYSSITPRHWWVCCTLTRPRPRPASPRRCRGRCPCRAARRRWPGQLRVGGLVGDDDQLCVLAAALLAHGLDRHVVAGEGRRRPAPARRRGRRRRWPRGSGCGSAPSAGWCGPRTPTRRHRGCRPAGSARPSPGRRARPTRWASHPAPGP